MSASTTGRRRLAGMAALVTVAAVLLAAASPAAAATGTPPTSMTPQLHDAIEARIADFQAQVGAPGIAVAVVMPGADGAGPEVTRFVTGTPTVGSGLSVEPTTQFEIGSETKVFTTDLLASLLAEGRVSLDDPVQKYAPAGTTVPVWTDSDTGEVTQITLRDLATHQAGLPDSAFNYWTPCEGQPDGCNPQPDYTRELLWKGLAGTQLLWQPGTNWLYSNFGFGLLGTILADLVQPPTGSERPAYEAVIKDTFVDALGMTSTTLGTGPRIATPYGSDGSVSYYWDDTNALAGEGGLVSDLEDMTTWTEAHLGYLPADAPQAVQTMKDTLQPQSTITTTCSDDDPTSCAAVPAFQMGLAWQLYSAGTNGIDTPWAYKNGGTAGFSTDTTLAPERGLGVTTMWNIQRATGSDPELGIELLKLIMQHEDRPVPAENPGGDHHKPALAETGSGDIALPTLLGLSLLVAGAVLVLRRTGRVSSRG
ncbi:serine hydrolase domain-containing protein [Cnuibacter sp. UC19_7]|uniref:serine hydrolase domain-containing protein n=1 Tax=Cnuibacter sp. UC19_7 TaxID=3350166 RepID=UPI00366B59A9